LHFPAIYCILDVRNIEYEYYVPYILHGMYRIYTLWYMMCIIHSLIKDDELHAFKNTGKENITSAVMNYSSPQSVPA